MLCGMFSTFNGHIAGRPNNDSPWLSVPSTITKWSDFGVLSALFVLLCIPIIALIYMIYGCHFIVVNTQRSFNSSLIKDNSLTICVMNIFLSVIIDLIG